MIRSTLALTRLRPDRVASALAWRAATTLYRRGVFRIRRVSGSPPDDALLVVACLWNRPQRIDELIGHLGAQHSDRPLRVLLWNNQRRDARFYRRRLRELGAQGAIASIELVDSPVNVGGMARFFAIARLRRRGYRGPVVMIDDDEDVSPDFVTGLLAAGGARTIAGFWAWTMHGAYWIREPARPGDPVSYVGTGGCVVDGAIVDLPGFFDIPRYFAFIEDLWMCGRARLAGWRLAKADVDVRFVLDETNQHHSLGQKKGELYDHLGLAALD